MRHWFIRPQKPFEKNHRLRPAYAGENMRHPCRSVQAARGLRETPAVFHISRKRARCPEFPARSSGQDRVCASLYGEAQDVQGTPETSQEIGDVGHPAIGYGIEQEAA